MDGSAHDRRRNSMPALELPRSRQDPNVIDDLPDDLAISDDELNVVEIYLSNVIESLLSSDVMAPGVSGHLKDSSENGCQSLSDSQSES